MHCQQNVKKSIEVNNKQFREFSEPAGMTYFRYCTSLTDINLTYVFPYTLTSVTLNDKNLQKV